MSGNNDAKKEGDKAAATNPSGPTKNPHSKTPPDERPVSASTFKAVLADMSAQFDKRLNEFEAATLKMIQQESAARTNALGREILGTLENHAAAINGILERMNAQQVSGNPPPAARREEATRAGSENNAAGGRAGLPAIQQINIDDIKDIISLVRDLKQVWSGADNPDDEAVQAALEARQAAQRLSVQIHRKSASIATRLAERDMWKSAKAADQFIRQEATADVAERVITHDPA